MQEQFESSEKIPYEPAKMEIVMFETADVIIMSNTGEDTGEVPIP